MDNIVTINSKKIKVSNLDKIFWPAEKYTKGDLIEYYIKISGYILPYLKNKPHTLVRMPNGINKKGFYQKNTENTPEWIKTKKIYSESNDEFINYLVCTDIVSLIYMVNLGCIDINPWFSRVNRLDNPDFLAIDLDPLNISFEKVKETALAVKEVLDMAKAAGFCKTSGATGIHIYVPLGGKYKFDKVRGFAEVLAHHVHNLLPDITSIERIPAKRRKKVYIDYLQNSRGQTLAAPYCVRPKPHAPVSTPLKWDEVKKISSPEEFNIKTIHKRLSKNGDLFSGALGKGIDILKCLKNLEKAA